MDERVKEAIVVEDNAGGLALFVFGDKDRQQCIWAAFGYEWHDEDLMPDLMALQRGDYPLECWDGGVDDPQAAWQEAADLFELSAKNRVGLIAEVANLNLDGLLVFPKAMGCAARRAFGFED